MIKKKKVEKKVEKKESPVTDLLPDEIDVDSMSGDSGFVPNDDQDVCQDKILVGDPE